MKLALVALVAGCHDDQWLQYEWDDRRVLCSRSIDDLSQDAAERLADSELERAASHETVALMHAHVPGVTISRERIEHVLATADALGLDYVTYPELDPAQPRRGALALCFDDSAISEWMSIRELLAAHAARVTFFVTRYHLFDDAGRAALAALASDGHAIEAHAVAHLNARDYTAEHGLPAYLADEVQPSIEILDGDGYRVTAFAYPFGASTAALDDALLERVARVRVSPGSCPY